MVTEKTQALLTALREQVEREAQSALDVVDVGGLADVEVYVKATDMLTGIMSHLLAASVMERHGRGESGREGIARFIEAKLAANEPRN